MGYQYQDTVRVPVIPLPQSKQENVTTQVLAHNTLITSSGVLRRSGDKTLRFKAETAEF